MFTSRGEHRLLLRIDNADLRLTRRGREIGLVKPERWARFQARKDRFDRNVDTIRGTTVSLPSGERLPAARALKQPDIRLSDLSNQGQISLQIETRDGTIDVASVETEF